MVGKLTPGQWVSVDGEIMSSVYVLVLQKLQCSDLFAHQK
jgi:hypothetical protein